MTLSVHRGQFESSGPTRELIAPHAIEAERSVLGAVLIVPSCLDDLAPLLNSDSFYLPAHRHIWDALSALRERGSPIDILSVEDELKARDTATRLEGGATYLVTLANGVPVADNVLYYARIVREKAILRAVIRVCAEVNSRAYSADAASAAILSSAVTQFADLESAGTTGQPIRLGDVMGAIIDAIRAKAESPEQNSVRTGLEAFDRLIGGFRPQQLVIVAARPGQGKTALAGTIARRAAKAGSPVLLFSLEMALQEMGERFLSAESRVDGHSISSGNMDLEKFRALHPAASKLAGIPLWLDDKLRTIGEISAISRSWFRRHGAPNAIVVIDYLGLIRAGERDETRTLEVGRMAWGAKAVAKELDVPVMLVSQLNRQSEKDNRRPILSDLRDSGEIEQHADMVIFPVRDTSPESGDQGPASLIVAKHRGGPTGEVPVYWHGPTMTFTDVSDS